MFFGIRDTAGLSCSLPEGGPMGPAVWAKDGAELVSSKYILVEPQQLQALTASHDNLGACSCSDSPSSSGATQCAHDRCSILRR